MDNVTATKILISSLDLTSLSHDDTKESITDLCKRAVTKYGNAAAVCIYPEFIPFEKNCRFIGCSHITEPDCGVKQALEENKISMERYDNYRLIYEEMKNIRKY